MRFKDAVQHLEGLGLTVEGPGGIAHPGRERLRKPSRRVPVRIAKNGMLSSELTEMIRVSRAQLNGSSKRRKPR